MSAHPCEIRWLLPISVTVLILSMYLFWQAEDIKRIRSDGHQSPNQPLAIVVLSARENFKFRDAIRHTWMAEEENVWFAIGRECQVHPNDRTDRYGCELFNIAEDYCRTDCRGWSSAVTEFLASQPGLPSISQPDSNLKFMVLHPLVVTELVIDNRCIGAAGEKADSTSEVSLYNRATLDKVVTVKAVGTRLKVQPLILPEGFEGELTVEGGCRGNSGFPNAKQPHSACSPLINCVHDGKRNFLVNFIYSVQDQENLDRHIAGKTQRSLSWAKLQAKVHRQLSEESRENGDVISLPTIDVYRHLPDKLLSSFEWLVENTRAGYIMKTDDDCYVDVAAVRAKLDRLGSVNHAWMGRKDWALDSFGKWAEFDYTAVSYPWFACGSGYILSREVVEWLAMNRRSLRKFQGEDVSLGIWLSALDVTYIDDPDFLCGDDGDESVAAGARRCPATRPELSAERIKAEHEACSAQSGSGQRGV